jgi:ribosomal 50S subunit-recycling heat shock protein
VSGKPAKPSQDIHPGQTVTLRFTQRILEVRLLQVPEVSISKKAAREIYEVLRDERTGTA